MSEKLQYGKIFKNHPIPIKDSSPKRKYDFSQMQVGDAILLPPSSAGCVTWLQRRFGWEMIRRTIDESSVMIWRIK